MDLLDLYTDNSSVLLFPLAGSPSTAQMSFAAPLEKPVPSAKLNQKCSKLQRQKVSQIVPLFSL